MVFIRNRYQKLSSQLINPRLQSKSKMSESFVPVTSNMLLYLSFNFTMESFVPLRAGNIYIFCLWCLFEDGTTVVRHPRCR